MDSSQEKYTPEFITSLKSNEIFVFGSNTEGRHGKGAALIAKNKFGAIYGQSHGRQGKSYAICTKALNKGLRSVPLKEIWLQLVELYKYAYNHPELVFYVSKIGCSLGGYKVSEIAGLFIQLNHVKPLNIILPKEFVTLENNI